MKKQTDRQAGGHYKSPTFCCTQNGYCTCDGVKSLHYYYYTHNTRKTLLSSFGKVS